MVIGNQYLFRENQELISSERMLTENLELELIKYQNDVNPDLFYDSLESLISLLHKDPFEAEDYIDKLALVYRHILSNKNAELTNFDKELEAVRNMIYLLNEKYGNTITLTNKVAAEISEKWVVVPGSLAKQVESIIRSTIITPIQPMDLVLEVESDDYFVLRHKLNQKLRTEDDHTVNDIQQAYSIFTEKPVVTIKAYGENHVKIPILVLDEALAI
jgi:LytS/YehU family sensor histidine kinase